MLQALLKNKLKNSFIDPHFKPSEDTLTSSIIGLMQYLPDDTFWRLLKNTCEIQNNELPETIGTILSINFWDKMEPDGEDNLLYVEPDVWIETNNYDVIIEAKKNDYNGQDEKQWKKEIISYKKTFPDSTKEFIFIALGGNSSLKNITIEVNNKNYNIFTASWLDLLKEITKLYNNIHNSKKEVFYSNHIRILNHLIEAFSKHNYSQTRWFCDLRRRVISKYSKDIINNLMKFDNCMILQDFYIKEYTFTYNNFSQIWTIK